MDNNLLKELKKIIVYRFNLDEDKASESDVIENIKKGVEFKGINIWTLIFAILIASIGLNVNSTAVIIGAMLISPLMGPIMGVGMGAGVFDFELIKKSGKNLVIATFIGLLASTIYFTLSPLHYAQSELLARTTPTIYDVLIAFFGGLAGIVASSRKKFNNVIPGVAIATALMPPLCTAGFGVATGQWAYFFGAFYLYLINSVFISIATFLIVRFLKYKPVNYVDAGVAARVRKWILSIAILTILPSLYLAYYFVNNEIFNQNANKLISEELTNNNFTVLTKKINPEKKEIELLVFGNGNIDSVKNHLELKKERFNLTNAKIFVKNSFNSENENIYNGKLKESLTEDVFSKQEMLIKNKNEEIALLKNQIAAYSSFSLIKENTIKEYVALYGKPQELLIEKSVSNLNGASDTLLIVIIKTESGKLNQDDIKNLNTWLSVKFNIKTIKIINE